MNEIKTETTGSSRPSRRTEPDSKVRINEVGVQMINEELRKYLFNCELSVKNNNLVDRSLRHLHKFNLNKSKLNTPIQDVNRLQLPKLRDKNLEEHFEIIGREQTDKYRKLMFSIMLDDIPPTPTNFEMQAGWTKYDPKTNNSSKVEYPDDDVLIFDVECLVLHQNCPVMAVALSPNAWYSWCSERLIQNDFNFISDLEYNDLIPLESKDLNERKNKKRLVIGHNVGFDRSFIKEQYCIEKSGMRFMDTMSMHIACYGFSSDQRDEILKKTDGVDRIPKFFNNESFVRSNNHQSYKWKEIGSLNNLKDVHQLYCPLSKSLEKESRDFFVKGRPKDILDNFQLLMKYCAGDVYATYEVFKNITPIFLERFPHPITLGGMLEMSTMYLPVNQNWLKFIENCQNEYDDTNYVLKKLLERSANQSCKLMSKKDEDLWLFDLDWSQKDFKLLKESEEKNVTKSMKAKSDTYDTNNKDNLIIDKSSLKDNPFYKVSSSILKKKVEDVIKEFSLNENTAKAFLTSKWIPKINQSHSNYPNWYKELCPKPNDENWEPGPSLISAKMRATPNFLRLKWNGHPMYFNKLDNCWGYLVPEDVYNYQQQIKPDKKNEKEIKIITVNQKSYVWKKIPHKDGEHLNVGNPLAKSFLNKIDEGILTSDPEHLAALALTLNAKISYWEMNEKRIKSQKVIWLENESNLQGAILPKIVPAGTITRRAVEPTWLTASNYKKERIGGELKAMIQAPNGYNIVGADVDSQELWIASSIGDSHFCKIHGSTALGWMNLQGKRSDETDMHSKTASMIGITRDQAKVFNYGRIYGAGRSFAEKLLMQFDTSLSPEEAKSKASQMYKLTKGRQQRDNINKWVDGTESEMFNKLEQIARSPLPRTPVLNAAITKTLEPENVGDDFITSRINWVVQSSAVDYLHIMLICMNWLIEEYKIQARFLISIHDELRYLVKEEDKYRAALALQITNLFTRSFFAMKLGFDDLPMSVAFFSGVDIDKCLRKDPFLEFISASNPSGLSKGYGIPRGSCLDIYKIIEITNGKLAKD